MTNFTKKDLINSARELYLELGLDKSHWSRWIKRNMKQNNFFKENKDWWEFSIIENGNKVEDFKITKNFACYLINQAKTIPSEKKIKVLNKYNLTNKIDVSSNFECEFYSMMVNFLKSWNVSIERQVSVCNNKYRLDFVICGNIVVEYDEEHHKELNNTLKDEERQKEIDDWYNKLTNECSKLIWIRVKKGYEIEALGKISFELAKLQAVIDCGINNYKIDDYTFKELLML